MSESSKSAETVQYNTTLVIAIELSSRTWVLAAQVPGLPNTKAKRTIEPDKLALQSAIDGYRARAAAAGYSVERVVVTYEAGWAGFWLPRWLIARGIEVHVVQPSSVPVDRRMRRAKSPVIEGTSPLFGVAHRAVFTAWCRSFGALLSRMRDRDWDYFIPLNVRLAGRPARRELTSDHKYETH